MIEVEHLSKLYGSTPAIRDVTFSVKSGDILGFLGPNGAGKTTTMRILTGYLPATSGTARIAGLDVHDESMAVRQKIGYLPESPPLYPDMTVEGFLKFVAEIKGVPRIDRLKRVNYALDRCNLMDRRKSLIRKLSKGYRQRVGIAQAIVHDPPVIILDEPTIGLDPKQIIDVRKLIKNLASDHTVILSTHILSEVSMTCNRVAIIDHGKVVATGSPQILQQEQSPGVIYYIRVGTTLDQVKQALSDISDIQSIRPTPNADIHSDWVDLEISSDSSNDIGSDIASALVSKGINLYEIRRDQGTLEQVFLDVTAKKTPAAATNLDKLEKIEPDQLSGNNSTRKESI